MNIKGKLGCINKTGILGDSAELYRCDKEDFFNYIEDGILSTVKISVENGLLPCVSCEGHDGIDRFGKSWYDREITYMDTVDIIGKIASIVKYLNKTYKFKTGIHYHIMGADTISPYNENDFKSKDIMTITVTFGSIKDPETFEKQKQYDVFIKKNFKTYRKMPM